MRNLFSRSQPLSKLPRLPETWLIATAQLRLWITPPKEKPYRPYVVLMISPEQGLIRGSEITPAAPTPEQVRDVLFKAARQPVPGGGSPGLPEAIGFTDEALAEAVARLLAGDKLELDILTGSFPPEVQDIIADLEKHMRGGPELPAMLSVKGVTPELVGAFFAAAADFYRAAPWVHVSNDQVIALRHPAEKDYRYAVVMGQGGVEYGLAVYQRWPDVENLFAAAGDPMETIPKGGAHSMFYDEIHRLAFGDVEALQQFGWEVAGEKAHPIAIILDKAGNVRRPAPIDLLWYEAALRAIPLLVDQHLKPDGQDDYLPLETTLEVSTHTGPVQVAVRYPAGQLALANRPAQETDWAALAGKEGKSPPPFDRRRMEGDMQQAARQMGAVVGSGDDNLDRAQELMYRAWEERNPAKRLILAHDALTSSPNCADAYVLLAEEEADTVTRALEYYRQGTAAGERALGARFFAENAGHFWGLLETRPYMRARKGLADTLWRMGKKEEARDHYRELLRLNPNDNQGNRYLLVDLLLQMGPDDAVWQLLDEYKGDWSAEWLYTHALLEFRKGGASDEANQALRVALGQNPHVPAYLAERKRIPVKLPDYIGIGDENEAVSYAADHLNHWRRTPGAVAWLTEQAGVRPSPSPVRRQPAAKKRKSKKRR